MDSECALITGLGLLDREANSNDYDLFVESHARTEVDLDRLWDG